VVPPPTIRRSTPTRRVFDFSDTSEAAVRYAIALAHNFGAQLSPLHVSDRAKFVMATEFPLGLDGTLEDAVRERLLKILTPRERYKPRSASDEATPGARCGVRGAPRGKAGANVDAPGGRRLCLRKHAVGWSPSPSL
jgi:hypothetical protein